MSYQETTRKSIDTLPTQATTKKKKKKYEKAPKNVKITRKLGRKLERAPNLEKVSCTYLDKEMGTKPERAPNNLEEVSLA